MATLVSGLAVRAARQLMNERSSLNQRPVRISCPISALIACRRSFCAASSAAGATHSPTTNVATTNTIPTFSSAVPAPRGDIPEPRMTVNSELLARCASTYSVPISTTTGNSS